MSTSTSTSPVSSPERRSPETSLGPVRRPSFVQLTQVELRKSVDYRAGRWLLGILLLLSVISLGWRLFHLDDVSPVSYGATLSSALTGPALLLPVLGVLAMTSEWTQRTALTTFTLSPWRVRVLLAKIAAAVLLAIAVVITVALLSAAAALLGKVISGNPLAWDRSPLDLLSTLLAHVLQVLMAAGLGAVLPITGAAVAALFVAPVTMSILSDTVLKGVAPWFDFFLALTRVEERDVDHLGQTATSLAVWVVLPLTVGLWLSSRREVK